MAIVSSHPEAVWDLVRLFFEARESFMEIHDRYESRVMQFAGDRGVAREHLRLNAEEVSGLLNVKELETLKNDYLLPLMQVSHQIFRTESATDPFDLYTSELYHECSILREDHYQVKTFAPQYQDTGEDDAYERILSAVHDAFPRKVHNLHDIFEKARRRLETMFPAWAEDKVLVRSLYLLGDDLLDAHYSGGLAQVYTIMYPVGGVAEGYLTVARSFLSAGFTERAREAAMKAVDPVDPFIVEERPKAEMFRMEARALLDRLGLSVTAESVHDEQET